MDICRVGQRLARHVDGAAHHGRVGLNFDISVEDRQQGIEIAFARGGEKSFDDFVLLFISVPGKGSVAPIRRRARLASILVSVGMSGSRFVTTRRIGGVERVIVQRVDHSDPPRRWAASGVEGPIRPSATISIEPLDGGRGSRVTFSLDFEGHGIGLALLPLVRRQTRKGAPQSYENLKRLLE